MKPVKPKQEGNIDYYVESLENCISDAENLNNALNKLLTSLPNTNKKRSVK